MKGLKVLVLAAVVVLALAGCDSRIAEPIEIAAPRIVLPKMTPVWAVEITHYAESDSARIRGPIEGILMDDPTIVWVDDSSAWTEVGCGDWGWVREYYFTTEAAALEFIERW